ncbi:MULTISPECIES: hypothetical protein [unclassified Streptomyces]|uniref:hypothetical protein n=1 Tax=unclassified Streptomyces TaxID=2593676 RepID=UPI002E29FD54|nr:hypothetical protein [Streptomyces sp. NBC_00223]
MLTAKLRGVLTATVLAVSLTMLTAACGRQPHSGGPGIHPIDGTSPAVVLEPPGPAGSDGKKVSAWVAYFSSSARVVAGVHEVLRDRGELDRFVGRAAPNDPKAAAEIVAASGTTNFSRYVLVGWTATTGCSAATSATLTRSGDVLKVRVSQPEPPPECLTPFVVTVVFAEPKALIPADPAFG